MKIKRAAGSFKNIEVMDSTWPMINSTSVYALQNPKRENGITLLPGDH